MFHVKHRPHDKEGDTSLMKKTMPRVAIKALRFAVNSLLGAVQWWEDRHVEADDLDYRMRELGTGLWQASQSLKALDEGEFVPVRRDLTLVPETAVLGRAYAEELLGHVPVPMRPAD